MVGLRFQQSTWFRRRDPVPSWILPLLEYLSHAQAESPRESVPRFLRMVTSGMEWCEESDVANGCHVRQLRRKILVHFFCPTTSPPDLLPLIPCISSHQRPFLSYSNPEIRLENSTTIPIPRHYPHAPGILLQKYPSLYSYLVVELHLFFLHHWLP